MRTSLVAEGESLKRASGCFASPRRRYSLKSEEIHLRLNLAAMSAGVSPAMFLNCGLAPCFISRLTAVAFLERTAQCSAVLRLRSVSERLAPRVISICVGSTLEKRESVN